MQLYSPTKNLFRQLQALLVELTPDDYAAPSSMLSGATIGQHTRHIIELFIELNNGYESGTVNYEKRRRDYRLETDNAFAVTQLDLLLGELQKADKELVLVTDLSMDNTGTFAINTTYYRELLFNVEHTVHHMALMRVGVLECTCIPLPQSFGVAPSTIKHRQPACAQ